MRDTRKALCTCSEDSLSRASALALSSRRMNPTAAQASSSPFCPREGGRSGPAGVAAASRLAPEGGFLSFFLLCFARPAPDLCRRRRRWWKEPKQPPSSSVPASQEESLRPRSGSASPSRGCCSCRRAAGRRASEQASERATACRPGLSRLPPPSSERPSGRAGGASCASGAAPFLLIGRLARPPPRRTRTPNFRLCWELAFSLASAGGPRAGGSARGEERSPGPGGGEGEPRGAMHLAARLAAAAAAAAARGVQGGAREAFFAGSCPGTGVHTCARQPCARRSSVVCMRENSGGGRPKRRRACRV